MHVAKYRTIGRCYARGSGGQCELRKPGGSISVGSGGRIATAERRLPKVAVMRMTRTPGYRTARPATAAPGRWYGSLDTVTDSERRGLRPIGMTAREVAAGTGVLLRAVPGVLVFQGVRPAAGELPRIPHAISAGRRLILVESVAWPAGRYRQRADGRIHCDGMYTGQSVLPLVSAVRYWQATLPRG